jgi:hypothetical protein
MLFLKLTPYIRAYVNQGEIRSHDPQPDAIPLDHAARAFFLLVCPKKLLFLDKYVVNHRCRKTI